MTNDELAGETGEESLHMIGEVAGETPAEDVYTLSIVGSANLTAPSGGPGYNDTDMRVFVSVGDHETGVQEPILSQYVRVYDSDEDEIPDAIQTLP